DCRTRPASGTLHRTAIELDEFMRQTGRCTIDVGQKTERPTKSARFVVQEPNGCAIIDDARPRASTRAVAHFEHRVFVFLHASKIALRPLVERECQAARTARGDASFRSVHFPR